MKAKHRVVRNELAPFSTWYTDNNMYMTMYYNNYMHTYIHTCTCTYVWREREREGGREGGGEGERERERERNLHFITHTHLQPQLLHTHLNEGMVVADKSLSAHTLARVAVVTVPRFIEERVSLHMVDLVDGSQGFPNGTVGEEVPKFG